MMRLNEQKKSCKQYIKKTLVSVLFFLFSNNLHQIHVECGILFEQQGLETLSEGFAAETIFPNFRRRKCKYIITGKNIFMLVNLLRSIILKPFGKTTTNFCERGIVARMSGRKKTKKFLLLCPMGELRLERPINTCTVHELPGFDINYSNLHKYHPIVQIYQDRTCRRNPNHRNFVFGEIESLDCCLHWAPNWTIREMPETGTEKANTTTLGWVLNTRQVRSNTKNVSEGKR